MSLKVIILWEDFGTNQLLLQDIHKSQQVLRLVITDIIDRIRWNWQSILTRFLLRRALHDTDNTLDDVIHISEVTLAVSVIEYLDGLSLHQFVGETKIRHIRAAGRTIDGKEAKSCRGDIIEFGIGMCHQLITFLRRRIEGYRIVNFIIRRIRNLFIGAIDRRGTGIHQMLDTSSALVVRVATSLQDVIEAYQVRLDIRIRIGDGITHTSLGGEVDNHRRMILFEEIINGCLVGNITLYKVES